MKVEGINLTIILNILKKTTKSSSILGMRKTVSMASHKNHNLGANKSFIIFLTSNLFTYFNDGFILKLKSQSIVYSINESEYIYIVFWNLKVKCTQYEICR